MYAGVWCARADVELGVSAIENKDRQRQQQEQQQQPAKKCIKFNFKSGVNELIRFDGCVECEGECNGTLNINPSPSNTRFFFLSRV